MSHLREEGDRFYRHIRLDWYVLVTKTGKDGYRTVRVVIEQVRAVYKNRYSNRYRDRQSDINYCVLLSSLFTCCTDKIKYRRDK